MITQTPALRLAAGVLCLLAGPSCTEVELGGSSSESDNAGSTGTGSVTSGDTDSVDGSEGGAGSNSGSGGGHDFPPPGPPGGDACPGLGCLPCGNGQQCAAAGDMFEGTCCAEGDALLHRSEATAAEAVDVEAANGLVFLCGGFGVRINDVSDPDAPVFRGAASRRCQRIAIGPTTPTGGQIFYLAHHGDTWIESPTLETFVLEPDAEMAVELDRIEDPTVSFEGIAYAEGLLYAAVHKDGLRVYDVSDTAPELLGTVGGFDNATKVAVSDGVLYVADQTGGVRILDLTDPIVPTHVAQIEVPGLARDVAIAGDVLTVSLGGDGVGVYDISDPAMPTERGHIPVDGSVQGVDVDERIIAVAAWSHVAVYDRDTLQLLATERVRPTPQFEQDFGVALDGDYLHVAEWEGHHVLEYRPGLVAPDLWIDEGLVAFSGDEPGLQVVAVRNRGYLDLDVDEIRISETDPFTVDTTWGRITPGSGLALEVGFNPEGIAQEFGTLSVFSNDPDQQQQPHAIPLRAAQTGGIDIGDELGPDFGFLDPEGQGQVEGLQGHVVVLAYFALF